MKPVILSFAVIVVTASAGDAYEPEDILSLMRANDAQCNNVILEYNERSYSLRTPDGALSPVQWRIDESVDKTNLPSKDQLFNLWSKYVVPSRPETPPDVDATWVALLRQGKISFMLAPEGGDPSLWQTTDSHVRLALRWPDVAAHKQRESGHFSRFSFIDGNASLLFAALNGREREWHHIANPKEISREHLDSPHAYQEEAIWTQLSLGIGYSRIIKSITASTVTDDNFNVTVQIDWFGALTGEGNLTLDHRCIVRHADMRFGQSHVLVTSDGLYESMGDRRFACARSGDFRNERSGRFDRRFTAALDAIHFNVPTTDFDGVADAATPKSETRYDISPESRQVHSTVRSISGRGVTTQRIWWIIGTLTIVLVLGCMTLRQYVMARRA